VNCLDAREQFSAVVAGMIGLSEWAPVEAHVGKCADCRKLLDHLYRTKPRNEPERARASTRPIEPPEESTRILEVVAPKSRSSHRGLWVSVVAVVLMLGAIWGLVAYGSRLSFGPSLVALLQKVRPEARQVEIAPAPSPPAPAPEPIPQSSAPPTELASTTPSPPVSAPEPKITAPAKAAPARPPASPSPPASLPSRVNKPPRPAPSRSAEPSGRQAQTAKKGSSLGQFLV
jgi:cytoskeletal protein RodZ